jgi:hypothetical protein
MNKCLAKITICLLLSLSAFAQNLVEKNQLNFSVDYKALNNGDVHYSFALAAPQQFSSNILALDSAHSLPRSSSRFLYNKIAYIVNKPLESFNVNTIYDLKHIRQIMPYARVNQVSKGEYQIFMDGLFGYNYRMSLEYDSPMVSTVNDSSIHNTIQHSQKLNSNLATAGASVYRKIYDFSKYTNAGLSVTNYYALGSQRTLVVTYNLSSVKARFALESVIRPNFTSETQALVKAERR